MTDQPPRPRPDNSAIIAEALRLNALRPKKATPQMIEVERARCRADPLYFIDTYCQIYDNATASWIKFQLWPAQRQTLLQVLDSKYTVVLKARQEGLSWLLGDAYPLWLMLFRPIQEILVFSQRDDEAKDLLERIKGTYSRLPDWLREGVTVDNDHEFRLASGSGATALPATAGGRSHAATYVVVDEADFIENVSKLVTAAKPTIDAGQNKLVMLSTTNIDTPGSYFQRQYVAARDNPQGLWRAIFLSWRDHPGRTQTWYDQQCDEAMRAEDSLDSVYKEYPETDDQALSARSRSTRYSGRWLSLLTHVLSALTGVDLPAITGLKVFRRPDPDRRYGIGADPAGGLADGDDSAACVVDAETLDQVASLGGKVEPTQFANMVADLSLYYNNAPILFELNNHGHAMLAQLKERAATLRNGIARDGTTGKPGWQTSERTKHMLYDIGAKVMQAALAVAMVVRGDKEIIDPALVTPIIHDALTSRQLAAIDVNELEAPESVHDDHATAWVLAQMCVYRGNPSMQKVPHNLWSEPLPEPARPGQGFTPTKPLARGAPPPVYVRPPAEQEILDQLKARGIKWRR